MINYVEHSS